MTVCSGRLRRDLFVGRSAELGELRAALAEAAGGQPRVALLHGEEGIGKTALLDRFLGEASHARVVRATAVESETTLSFGIVDQWLRSGGDPDGSVFGNDPQHPLVAGMRLLGLLGGHRKGEADVLVLDDAQWADAASLAALMFVVRRLQDDRTLVLVGTRDDVPPASVAKLADGPNGRRIRLGPLALKDLEQLVTAAGLVPAARSVRTLLQHTHGNPLHARALLEELGEERWLRPDLSLPAPHSFASVIAERMRRLPDDARALVEAVAVLGTGHSLQLAITLAGVDDALDALEAAADAGLLESGEPFVVAVTHPLVAAAVLDGIGPGRRARLHAAAAELVDDPARALHHRAAAAIGPDATLASEFEALAEAVAGRGGRLKAAEALLVASRLTPSPELRDERLLKAIDWLSVAGDISAAQAFARQVAALPRSARRDSVLSTFALAGGHADEAVQFLSDAWKQCDPADDPALAARIAHRTGFNALVRLDDPEVVTWTQRARTLAPDDVIAVESTAMLALALWRLGRQSEAYRLLHDSLTADAETDAQLHGMRGWLLCADGELAVGARDLAFAVEIELRQGALHIATSHLAALSRAHYALGAWEDAVVASERAVALASELEGAAHRAFVWWAAVAVPAARGDWDAVEPYLTAAAREPLDVPDRLVAVGMAQALPAVARGDHAAVLRALGAVASLERRESVDAPGFWPWQDLYAEALVAADRVEEAEAFLGPQQALARERSNAPTLAKLARARGKLEAKHKRSGVAQAAFAESIERLEALAMPYELALSQLSFGQFLRRQRRRAGAIHHLTAARETFIALGAATALGQCTRELEACGLPTAPTGGRPTALLTPQEQAVARLVATGRTNRELAAELLLSPKTIEVHLTRIYAKLGISSRTQLAAHVGTKPAAR